MRLAESIRYGGNLVSAEDCDYDAYKHLGLICPECKNPVFLRGEYLRVAPKSGEQVLVKPSFAHFKAADPTQIIACENRVASYDRQELERRANKARNQRLKLLQRWFWQVFTDCNGGIKGVIENEFNTRFVDENSLDAAILLLKSFTSQEISNGNYQVVEKFINESDINKLKSDSTIQKVQYLTKIDRRFHAQICSEVIEFLRARSSSHLLKQALNCVHYMVGITPTGKQQLLEGEVEQVLLSNLTSVIVLIPWAVEFEKLQQSSGKKELSNCR